MELMSSLFSVAVISLLAAISPGPDFFVVVKNSLCHSRKMGQLTALGVSLALLIHLTYTLVGLGVVITESSVIYYILKYGGAGYLFYIGCKGLISSFKPQESLEVQYAGVPHTMTSTIALKQGFLTNLLNPKCALFFVSLFSQFIGVDTPLALKMGYACINWCLSCSWFLFLSYLITGQLMVSRIGRFRMLIDRIMGGALMILSLKLILT